MYQMEFMDYFWFMRRRPDRVVIHLEWVFRAIDNAVREEIQSDGRIAFGGRYLKWRGGSSG